MALEKITAVVWVIGDAVAGKSLFIWLLAMQLLFAAGSGIN